MVSETLGLLMEVEVLGRPMSAEAHTNVARSQLVSFYGNPHLLSVLPS